MKINELNIPKSIIRHTQATFDKDKKAYWRDHQNMIQDTLEKNGWKQLGAGLYSSVYENPKKSYIIKINHQADSAFKHYVDTIHQHKNRHFPIISDVKKIDMYGYDYYVYLIEKLYPFSGPVKGYIKDFIFHNGNLKHAFEHGNKNMEDAMKYFQKHQELAKAIKIILTSKDRHYLDVNHENIMQRKDGTVVITDPYS